LQELFLESFAKHCHEKTAKDKRKVVQYKDLGATDSVRVWSLLTPLPARTVSEKDEYEFLIDIIPEQVPASSIK